MTNEDIYRAALVTLSEKGEEVAIFALNAAQKTSRFNNNEAVNQLRYSLAALRGAIYVSSPDAGGVCQRINEAQNHIVSALALIGE